MININTQRAKLLAPTAGTLGSLDRPAASRCTTRRSDLRRHALGALLLSPLVFNAAPAAATGLDTTFGVQGKATMTFPDNARAFGVAVAADGAITLTGNASSTGSGLAHYLASGVPDPAFGANGRLSIPLTQGLVGTGPVVLQADGTPVVAGNVQNGTASIHFTRIVVGQNEVQTRMTRMAIGASYKNVFSLATTADGTLYAPGAIGFPPNSDVLVVAVDAALSPVSGFGSGGVKVVDLGGDDAAFGVVVQADGKVAVAGRSTASGIGRFFVMRMLADGSFDPTFGNGGVVLTAFPGGRSADGRALALQPDGKLVVAGSVAANGTQDLALARYLPDGSLDPSFGAGGLVIADLGGSSEEATALLRTDDGTLIVAGSTNTASASLDGLVVAFRPDGSRDETFGDRGTAVVDFGGNDDEIRALAMQGKKIIAAGYANPNGLYRFALARFTREASPQPVYCHGVKATVVGTRGNDVLIGTPGRDVVAALGGNDRIRMLGGNDLICAGAGDDVVDTGPGNDVVYGEAGNDQLLGGAGDDNLSGGPGSDRLDGGSGRDTCRDVATSRFARCERTLPK